MIYRKRRRRLSWYLIWFTIFFFFVAAVFSLILSLPLWKIRTVSVIDSAIVSKAYVDKLSSYLIGENLFLADYSKLRDGLKKIYQLKDFGIWRSPPSTVIVKLVERKPFCVVIISGTSAVIDDEGFFLLAQGGKAVRGDFSFIVIENTADLPAVRGIDAGKVLPNKLAPDISEAIKVAVKRLSRFFTPSNLQFEMKKNGDLNLLIEDVLKVYFGSTENIEKKVGVLESLLPVLKGKWDNIKYIDIRVADDPVVRFL